VLEEWEHDVESVELVTGTGGVFDVWVDDERVFTKSMLGRYPDPDDVMPYLRAKLP
jgi:predicted Rdx family selenoprotein